MTATYAMYVYVYLYVCVCEHDTHTHTYTQLASSVRNYMYIHKLY